MFNCQQQAWLNSVEWNRKPLRLLSAWDSVTIRHLLGPFALQLQPVKKTISISCNWISFWVGSLPNAVWNLFCTLTTDLDSLNHITDLVVCTRDVIFTAVSVVFQDLDTCVSWIINLICINYLDAFSLDSCAFRFISGIAICYGLAAPKCVLGESFYIQVLEWRILGPHGGGGLLGYNIL